MNSSNFSFKPHLEMAHKYWSAILTKEELAIDATCGNGHDTFILASLAKTVYAFDIQSDAINAAKQKVSDNVIFYQQCHSKFPPEIPPVKLIVYNLGYLPGGDKSITTMSSTTLASLKSACLLLAPGGMISVTCYPGHEEGRVEENLILAWAQSLSPEKWLCCHHRWINKERSPSLLCLTQRALGKLSAM